MKKGSDVIQNLFRNIKQSMVKYIDFSVFFVAMKYVSNRWVSYGTFVVNPLNHMCNNYSDETMSKSKHLSGLE